MNNYTEVQRTLLQQMECRYIVIGREVGEQGTRHLQGYVVFSNGKTMRSVSRLIPNSHLEVSRGLPSEAANYCKKDGDWWEKGDCPVDPARRGENEMDRWNEARKAACEGRFDDIPSDIYTRYRGSYHAMYNYALEHRHLEDNDVLHNIWYWGRSGCGKSRRARREYPNAYLKNKNKWWNGYTDQEAVIVDDIDPSHRVWIGAFLKEWTDHYRFQAETKGGCRVIRPKTIVVTSQYTIGQIFDDPETVDALLRRFDHILIE